MNLTEQERGALIDFVEEVIERGEELGYSARERKVFEIALASLTAKPIYQIETVNNEWVDVSKTAFDSSKSDRKVLYTAPPVPVMKPVEGE